eukprot:3701639-Amphidinium_carterae.1
MLEYACGVRATSKESTDQSASNLKLQTFESLHAMCIARGLLDDVVIREAAVDWCVEGIYLLDCTTTSVSVWSKVEKKRCLVPEEGIESKGGLGAWGQESVCKNYSEDDAHVAVGEGKFMLKTLFPVHVVTKR